MVDYIKYKSGCNVIASDINSTITSNVKKYKIPHSIKKAEKHNWLSRNLQIEFIEDNTIEFDVEAYVSLITGDRRLIEDLNEKFRVKYQDKKIFIL